MNAEYAVDSVIGILTNKLNAALITLQYEAGSSLVTPTPEEYKFGDRDPSNLTVFPTIIVKANRSFKKDDQYEFQERVIAIEVITWIVNEDEETLHRFVLRYGDAIQRVLRKESNWPANLHSPKAENAQYSDIYLTSFGLAQGVLNQVEIRQIIS
ncbi:MAG: hypothetical protein WC934_07650 [Acidithiobacillus sp.]|jgi:hypothetical protein|uniref:hypothetical protein n=1 Tax=Acidithiobacillus sp. TaxID=1872118 RepID=UPI00355DE813